MAGHHQTVVFKSMRRPTPTTRIKKHVSVNQGILANPFRAIFYLVEDLCSQSYQIRPI
jgi:hypothetical protein